MNAIIYAHSVYGATLEVAGRVANILQDSKIESSTHRIDRSRISSPSEIIVVGAPIYGGAIAKRVVRFCERNRELLAQRRVALFTTGLYRDEKAKEQLESNFPAWILAHSCCTDWLGGRVRRRELKRLDRLIISHGNSTEPNESIDRIDHNRIVSFCECIVACSK